MKIFPFLILFLFFLAFSALAVMSSSSWMMMWLGLEINMISFIPIMTSKATPLSAESALKYFLTQVMASSMFLMGILLMLNKNEFISPQMNSFFSMIMVMSMLTKMGAAPFHYWMPSVVEGLPWMTALVLLTTQKMAPISVTLHLPTNSNLMIFSVITGLIISPIQALNQTSLRKIMVFSSINHVSWMLASSLVSTAVLKIYFLVYLLTNLILVSIFSECEINYIPQMWKLVNNKFLKMTLLLNFLSLSGIPPMLGFLPKWLVINWMVMNLFWLSMIMIISTLMMTYVYIRMTISLATLNLTTQKLMKINFEGTGIMMLNFLSFPGLLLSTLIFCYI